MKGECKDQAPVLGTLLLWGWGGGKGPGERAEGNQRDDEYQTRIN